MRLLINLFGSLLLLTIVIGCGGGGGGSTNPAGSLGGATSYTIGGTVSGLGVGDQVVLTLNGDTVNTSTVSSNTTFTFSQAVAGNGTYAVAISAAPAGKTCSVVNGSGAGVAANISNVSVTCSTNGYQIGGTVAGLASQPVVLVLNGDTSNTATVSSNGAFTFSQSVAYSGTYTVTVGTQPADTTCSVSSGAGANVTADVSNISVLCTANAYAVSGTITGVGAQTTLLLNGDVANAVTLSSDGSFSFTPTMAHGATYTVTVGTQPTDLKYCRVTNATGTATAAVSNVTVSCAAGTWVVTEIANSTTAFPADPVLDPVNAANNVVRTIPATIKSGYFDINGNYYFTNNSGVTFTYYKITSSGVKTSFVINNAAASNTITGDSAGNVYTAGTSKLFKISTNGNISEMCSSFSPPLSAVTSVVFDEISNTFYVTDSMQDRVFSINPTSCVVSQLNGNGIVTQPQSSVLGPSNNLYIATIYNVYTMNKATGVLSSAINSTRFNYVNGMVFDSTGYLYLSLNRSLDASAMASNGSLILLASGVSSSTDQIGIGRNANGDIYLTLRASRKIIKLSRP